MFSVWTLGSTSVCRVYSKDPACKDYSTADFTHFVLMHFFPARDVSHNSTETFPDLVGLVIPGI